jgi:hypothetical protein
MAERAYKKMAVKIAQNCLDQNLQCVTPVEVEASSFVAKLKSLQQNYLRPKKVRFAPKRRIWKAIIALSSSKKVG